MTLGIACERLPTALAAKRSKTNTILSALERIAMLRFVHLVATIFQLLAICYVVRNYAYVYIQTYGHYEINNTDKR